MSSRLMPPANSSLLCKKFLAGSTLSVVEFRQVILVKPRRHNCPLTQNKRPISRAARYAAASSLSTSRRNSASGIANSVKPQFKQTRKLWKNPNYGFVQSFESREVNRKLTIERALVG